VGQRPAYSAQTIATNPKVKTCAGIPHFFAAPDILSGIFRYFFEVTGIFLKRPIYSCSKVEGRYPAAPSP
jgi:hypothetical protein